LTNFREKTIKSHEIPFRRERVFPCWQMDRQLSHT